MTKEEYEEYTKIVNTFFKTEGVTNLSIIPDKDPYFSWTPCDCCQSPLGGDRYDANGYNLETKEILEFTVCTDCIYFAEYGQLDDMTMLDIEK